MAGRKAGQGSNWIRKDKRLAIYLRDGLACVYCGCSVEQGLATLDHLHPSHLGGQNVATNLVTACLSCNSSKQDLSVKSFAQAALRDRGIDTSTLAAKIRKHTSRKLGPYRATAKKIMEDR